MNSWEEFLYWEHKSRQTIDFKVIYVDVSGDLIAGLMLSQIVYWHLPNKDGQSKLKVKHDNKEWLARSDSEWMNEVRITKAQARRARQILSDKNIIEERVYKFNGIPTTHIRLNESVLMKLIHEIYSNEMQIPFVTQDKSICVPAQVHLCSSTSPFVFQHKSITETTTKTTSEITTEIEESANADGYEANELEIEETKKNKSAKAKKPKKEKPPKEQVDIWIDEIWNPYPVDRRSNSKKLVREKLSALKDENEKPVTCTQEVATVIAAAAAAYNEHLWQYMPDDERRFIPRLENFIGKGYWLPSLDAIIRKAKIEAAKYKPKRSQNKEEFNKNLNSLMGDIAQQEQEFMEEMKHEKLNENRIKNMIGDHNDI